MSEQEHEFEGAFCAACGVDEASSFANEPCEGFEEATSIMAFMPVQSHEQDAQNTEENTDV